MRNFGNKIGHIGEALELLALVAFVAFGPLVWMYRLFADGGFLQLSLVAVPWLVSVFFIGQEVRRKSLTVVSLGIFLTWMVVLGYVFHEAFYR